MPSGQHSIGIGDVCDGLSESDRRTTLRTLRRRSTPVELDALGLFDYDASEGTVRWDREDDGVTESLRDAKQMLDGPERGDE